MSSLHKEKSVLFQLFNNHGLFANTHPDFVELVHKARQNLFVETKHQFIHTTNSAEVLP